MSEENKNLKVCKACGQEIAKSAKVCPGCGAKNKKPFYKKWWVIALAAIVVIGIFASSGDKETKDTVNNDSATKSTETESAEIVYTPYDVSELVSDLEDNALKAEKKYDKQYVEIKGVLSNVDSDGSYISLDPINNDFNFISVMCNTKNDEQIDMIAELSKGDVITVKGKVTSVGEVLGYSIDIDEIIK